MKRSAHASVSLLRAGAWAGLALTGALLSSCSGGEEAVPAAGTVVVEWHDPQFKRAKKSEGTTLYGQYVGPRTWWYKSGKVEKKGQYDEQGRETGEWVEFHNNDLEAARYQYAEGAMTGPYLAWFANGDKKEEGAHVSGEKSGEWLRWHEGTKEAFKGSFAEGRPVGVHVSWHANGEVFETGEYVDGAPVGLHQGFSPSGQLVGSGEYSATGQALALSMWHEDGSDAHVVPFVAGKPHGTERMWWENGQLRYEKTWENGAQIGEGRHWHSDGARHLVTNWEAGRLSGVVREWHPNGRLAVMVAHDAGSRTGVLRRWYADGAPSVIGVVEGELSNGLQQQWWPGGSRKQIGVSKDGLREGPWAVWDESGALVAELSGVYAADRRVSGLDEAGLAQAAAWAADTSPQPAATGGVALVDPLEQYDVEGEPLDG
jgi:antitoxin component YwqK of YwqJK toxin-antitoxin module